MQKAKNPTPSPSIGGMSDQTSLSSMESEMKFDELPPEVLVEVIGFLDKQTLKNFVLVCQRFLDLVLSHTPSFWKKAIWTIKALDTKLGAKVNFEKSWANWFLKGKRWSSLESFTFFEVPDPRGKSFSLIPLLWRENYSNKLKTLEMLDIMLAKLSNLTEINVDFRVTSLKDPGTRN